MRSFTSRQFREMYANLPAHVQLGARRAYQLFKRHPTHPGLRFKCVDEEQSIYSARVGINYRALGQMNGDEIVWFWIGHHSSYDRILRS
jgi:hypothetical protein